MNDTNIGSGGSQSPIGGTHASLGVPAASQGIPLAFYTSVLEKSDQEAAFKQSIAGVPVLASPNLALLNLQTGMNEITNNVLKSWSDSVAKEAETVKEIINSPTYLAKREELNKIATGVDKVQLPDSDSVEIKSTGNGVIKSIGNTTKVDIVDKYAWLQFMGAVATTPAFLQVNSVAAVDQGGGIKGIGTGATHPVLDQSANAAIGVAAVLGGVGIQNAQGVQDAKGNITGIREINTNDKFDPLSNPEKFNRANAGSTVDETELTDSKSTGAAQFMGQSILIAACEIVLFQAGAAITTVAAVNAMHMEGIVIQNLWGSISAKPADQASLAAGWLSSLWGIGLVYQTSAEKVMTYGGDKAKDKEALNMDFVKTYAQKVLDNVNSPQFLASFLAGVAKADPKGSQDPDVLLAKAKIVLLSLALGLLAKLEVGSHKDDGWINELDFAGLLNGDTDIHQSDLFETAGIKGKLIAQINDLLEFLGPQEGGKVKSSLLSFMSTNPDLDSLLDQQEGFEKVLNQPSFEQSVFGKVPV